MLELIENILRQVNASYKIIYETPNMANVDVDELNNTSNFVHIEEFRDGKYVQETYQRRKIYRMELYFCKSCEMQDTAKSREALRSQIEGEIVKPFIEAYENSNLFGDIREWIFGFPPPQFDANEVGIILRFECKITEC